MSGDEYEGGGEIVPANGTAIEPATKTLPAGYEHLDSDMVSGWIKAGGEDHHLGQVQGAALTVLNELDAHDRQAVEADFDALPGGAQTAIFTELSLPGGGSAKSASPEDLAAFEATDEGFILAEFWKGRAAKNLGRVNQRVGRIRDAMLPSEWAEASAFFDALPSRGKIAVMCLLAE